MIEVIFTRGSDVRDVAHADSPETALLAARTMWNDDKDEWPIVGFDKGRQVTFTVDGVHVRTVIGRRP